MLAFQLSLAKWSVSSGQTVQERPSSMRSPAYPLASGLVTVGGNDISKEMQTLVCIQEWQGHSNLLNCSDTTGLKTSVSPQILKIFLRMSAISWPVIPKFGPEVVHAVQIQLDEDLHREVSDSSHGKRGLAIARSVAMHPSVLFR